MISPRYSRGLTYSLVHPSSSTNCHVASRPVPRFRGRPVTFQGTGGHFLMRCRPGGQKNGHNHGNNHGITMVTTKSWHHYGDFKIGIAIVMIPTCWDSLPLETMVQYVANNGAHLEPCCHWEDFWSIQLHGCLDHLPILAGSNAFFQRDRKPTMVVTDYHTLSLSMSMCFSESAHFIIFLCLSSCFQSGTKVVPTLTRIASVDQRHTFFNSSEAK